MKFKFTHSGIYSSKNCFNKIYSKNLLAKYKIPTPIFFKINPNLLNKRYLDKYKKKFGKFIIKPNESGSSFGVKIFKTINDINYFSNNLKKNLSIYKEHKDLFIVLQCRLLPINRFVFSLFIYKNG